MNPFSTKFEHYFDEKQMKIADIEKFSGINRSTLYKLLNGTREPTSSDVVRKIADALCLNFKEQNELMEAYRLTRLGPVSYYGRKEVRSFFREIGHSEPAPAAPFLPFAAFDLEEGQRILLQGSQNVNLALEYFLYAAVKRNKREAIRINEPLLDDVTLSLVDKVGKIDPKVEIRQIVILDDSIKQNAEEKGEIYNVRALRKILPVMVHHPNFEVYYRYVNINSVDMTITGMPNYIIAGEYLIQYSTDHQHLLAVRDKELLSFYAHLFDSALLNSQLLVKRSTTTKAGAEKILHYFRDVMRKTGDVYHFVPGLSIVQLMVQTYPPEVYIKEFLMSQEPQSKLLLRLYELVGEREIWKYGSRFSPMIPQSSIEYFIETGYIPDLPTSEQTPVSIPNRIRLLQHWEIMFRQKKATMIEFDEQNFNPSNLFLGSSMADLYFAIPDQLDSITVCTLQEPSIVHSFYDFMDDLAQRKVLSPDDAASYIQQKIVELRSGSLAG